MIIHRTVINLNEMQIRTLEHVRIVVDGTETPEIAAAPDAQTCCEWIALTRIRLHSDQLKRANCGLVMRYLGRLSGFSRTHITRRVQRWLKASASAVSREAP